MVFFDLSSVYRFTRRLLPVGLMPVIPYGFDNYTYHKHDPPGLLEQNLSLCSIVSPARICHNIYTLFYIVKG